MDGGTNGLSISIIQICPWKQGGNINHVVPIGFWLPLAHFPVPEVFVADGLCSCLLVLGVFPSPLIRPPFFYVIKCGEVSGDDP